MRSVVFCETTAKAVQSFYISVGGKRYYLFSQDFRKSNKRFFSRGVELDTIGTYKNVHSTSVRKTLDKLPIYIKYIEKEYGVEILESTRKKTEKRAERKKLPYKRTAFKCQEYVWEVA